MNIVSILYFFYLLPSYFYLFSIYLFVPTHSNLIMMNITSTNLTVGRLSNVTISLDRSRSPDGNSISPTNITTSNYKVQIKFDLSYAMSSQTFLVGITNYTITLSTNIILINYNYLANTSINISITIAKIKNPLFSNSYISTYVQISDGNNNFIDQSFEALSYSPALFLPEDIVWQFNPKNVSTTSNLTFTITTQLFYSNLVIQLSFRKWWLRSLINTSLTSSMGSAACSECIISRMPTASSIIFQNMTFTLINNGTLKKIQPLILIGAITPPSLQLVDQIQIVMKWKDSNSIIQKIDNLVLGASLPNSFEVINPSTTSTISQIVDLSIQVISRNVFGPNDTITIKLTAGSELLSTDPKYINLVCPLVSGYQADIQDFNTIVFSSFLFYSSNYARLDCSFTLNRIVQSKSTKPRINNQIELKRNGYLYNLGNFQYSVQQATMTSVQLSIENNFANSLTTGTWVLTFSKKVIKGDKIFLNIPKQITVLTCQPFCNGCICNIALPNLTTPYTQILILLETVTSNLSQVTIQTRQRNPIQSSLNITTCSTDSQNYTKQCGVVTYPNIVEASLFSETLSILSSNLIVYGISNYTFSYDFSNYDLQNGFLWTIIPTVLKIADINNIICRINGQAQCTITINSSGTYINTAITQNNKIYVLTVNNMRNPPSTAPFQISAKVAYISGQIYYSILSNYTSVILPYQLFYLTHYSFSRTSCVNSDISNSSVGFFSANLPFSLINSFPLINNYQYKIVNKKTNVTIYILYQGTGNLTYMNTNWYSYEPIEYVFTLFTGDLLYMIWQFSITTQNCQPSQIPITAYQFTGLPQSDGTLTIIYPHQFATYLSPTNPSYSIKVTFPSQYPLNLSLSLNTSLFTISTISPRFFSLKVLVNQQPLIIQFTGFKNSLNLNNIDVNSSNSPVKLQIFDNNYLISENNNTIIYKLSEVSNCKFPCKRCVNGDGASTGSCLQCFSSSLTNNYLLLNTINGSNSIGRCVSNCPPSTFVNITLRTCQPCPSPCSLCQNLTYCVSCITNFYFFNSNNSCLTDCPQKYYPSNINQTCELCSQPCLTCTNNSFCTSCVSGTYFYVGTCVTACPTNFIPQISNSSSGESIQTCFRCSSPCLQCSQNLNNCTKCITGFYLTSNNLCVSQCSGLQIGYQGVCTSCGSTCYKCIQNPNNCISCNGQFSLYNFTCILNCPINFYSSNSTCLSCPTECFQCNSNSQCSICANGFIFYQNFCYSSCPTSMYISNTTLINTSTNTTTLRKECRSCISSCLSCPDGANLCIACVSGFLLYQNACFSSCPIGTFVLGTNCKNCSLGCLNCLNEVQCFTCTTQLALYDSKCVVSCPQNMIQINNTCQLCRNFIQNCQTCTSLGCINCITSYFLFINSSSSNNMTNGVCLLQCPIGFLSTVINNVSQCISCVTGCKSCSTAISNCTSCLSGFYFNQGSCVIVCPGFLIPVDGICQVCRNPCLTCSNNNTLYCQSCVNNMSLLIRNNTRACVPSCPTGYYEETGTKKCNICPNGCSSCNSLGCFTCSTGFYYKQKLISGSTILYDCVSECPATLPFINPTNLCSKCSQHCLKCASPPNNTCYECQSNLLIYFELCLASCPNPYQILNKECVLPSNNTNNNTVNETVNTTNTTTNQTNVSLSYAPIPFTITISISTIAVLVSRLQIKFTSIPMGILSLASLLVPVCDIYYFASVWSNQTNVVESNTTTNGTSTQQISKTVSFVKIGLYLILSGLAVIYTSNIIHLIFSFASYRKDPLFKKYLGNHKIWGKIAVFLSMAFQHFFFVILFSRLFNLSLFKAQLKTLLSFTYINYIWGIAIVGNILGLIAGIIFLSNQSYLLYPGIDLIIVNLIAIIFGLILFKKSKGSGWLEEDYKHQEGYEESDEQFSTKKVVMLNNEGDSDAQIGTIFGETLQELNGKITTGKEQVKIANNSNNDEDNEFYFEETNPDNLIPNNQKLDENAVSKEGEKLAQNSGNDENDNGSESTDPLKIQPSLNLLLTAQDMKPTQTQQDIFSNKQIKQRGDDFDEKKSLGWSSIEKGTQISRILLKQQKIVKSKNIFEEEQQEANEEVKQQKIDSSHVSDQREKMSLNIQSNNSSKSLKATPRVHKQDVDTNPISHNLATIGLSKSRRIGGRSQQVISFSDANQQKNEQLKEEQVNNQQEKAKRKEQDKVEEESEMKETKLSPKRTGSKSSYRIIRSQMGIIEEENQENYPRHTVEKAIKKQVIKAGQSSDIVRLKGQLRFLSNTLDQDHKVDSVSELESDINLIDSPSKRSIDSPHKKSMENLKLRQIRGKSRQELKKSRNESKEMKKMGNEDKKGSKYLNLSYMDEEEVQSVVLKKEEEKQTQQKQKEQKPKLEVNHKIEVQIKSKEVYEPEAIKKNAEERKHIEVIEIQNANGLIEEIIDESSNAQHKVNQNICQKQGQKYQNNDSQRNQAISVSDEKKQNQANKIIKSNKDKEKEKVDVVDFNNIQTIYTKQENDIDLEQVRRQERKGFSPNKEIFQQVQTIDNNFLESQEDENDNEIIEGHKDGFDFRQFMNQQYRTLQNKLSRGATSDGFMQTSSKLRGIKIKRQVVQRNRHESLNKGHKKSFRSRNISVDKLRPTTVDPQSEQINEDGQRRGINTRALMKQIERKEKFRQHQQSLKKIYLGK